jgi:hypothetical protein
LSEKYGPGAPELFAHWGELSDVGGHAGVTRYLYRVYTERPDLRQAFPDIEGKDAWRLVDWAYNQENFPELLPSAWLNEPAAVGGAAGITRYLYQLYAREPKLQEAFPNLAGEDARRYIEWVRTDRVRYDVVLQRLIASGRDVPEFIPGRRRAAARERGVNVVGYLRSELGVGEAGRLVVKALERARVPVVAVDCRLTPLRGDHPFPTVNSERATFDTNLLCLNPGHDREFLELTGSELDRYTIASGGGSSQAARRSSGV